MLAAITAFFSFAESVSDKLPDWIQRRKTEFFVLKTDCKAEWNKPTIERDDRLADELRIKLYTFSEAFWSEIQAKSEKK